MKKSLKFLFWPDFPEIMPVGWAVFFVLIWAIGLAHAITIRNAW